MAVSVSFSVWFLLRNLMCISFVGAIMFLPANRFPSAGPGFVHHQRKLGPNECEVWFKSFVVPLLDKHKHPGELRVELERVLGEGNEGAVFLCKMDIPHINFKKNLKLSVAVKVSKIDPFKTRDIILKLRNIGAVVSVKYLSPKLELISKKFRSSESNPQTFTLSEKPLPGLVAVFPEISGTGGGKVTRF